MTLLNENNCVKIYQKKGYFVIRNVLNSRFIQSIIKEVYSAKNTDQYFDTHGNLRRIEKLYDKGVELKRLNKKILLILKRIFKKDFLIFKDKFNAKPPGGDGFFAHFDGVFKFKINDKTERKGWYEYSNFFINALIALDNCNKKNGTIELSRAHNGDFEDLLKKTRNDGTPALNKKTLSEIKFERINLKRGDVVFFSNTCPHQSKKNFSKNDRRILYYTYTDSKYGSKYLQYYKDKKKSKNKFKALEEKKIKLNN